MSKISKNIRQRKFRQAARISSTSARARVLPYHCISQSFDLPPTTTSVSHLTCPLPPHHQSELVLEIELVLVLEIELALALDIEHYHITTSVSHLTCPLPQHHQSELTLVLEIELVLTLDMEHYHITT